MDAESININRQLTDGNIFKDYTKKKKLLSNKFYRKRKAASSAETKTIFRPTKKLPWSSKCKLINLSLNGSP